MQSENNNLNRSIKSFYRGTFLRSVDWIRKQQLKRVGSLPKKSIILAGSPRSGTTWYRKRVSFWLDHPGPVPLGFLTF